MQWHLPFSKKDLRKAYEKGRLDAMVELQSNTIGRVVNGVFTGAATKEELNGRIKQYRRNFEIL